MVFNDRGLADVERIQPTKELLPQCPDTTTVMETNTEIDRASQTNQATSTTLGHNSNLGDRAIARIPTELWSEINEYLPLKDQIAFMLICRWLHDISAYNIYKILDLCGSRATRCFVILASGRPLGKFYVSFVRQLTYYTYESCDRLLTFPILARALQQMVNLHTLNLNISHDLSHYLMYSLDRRPQEAIEEEQDPVAIPTGEYPVRLPFLQTLRLNGGALPLIPFLKVHSLVEFDFIQFLSRRALRSLLKAFEASAQGQKLRILQLRFQTRVDIPVAITALDAVFPNLTTLCIEQPNLKVMDLLTTLATKHNLFGRLERLLLNRTDIWPQFWKLRDESSRANIFMPLLQEICEWRYAFRLVTFGDVGYNVVQNRLFEEQGMLNKEGVYLDTAWCDSWFTTGKPLGSTHCRLVAT